MNDTRKLPEMFPGQRYWRAMQGSVDAILSPMGIKRRVVSRGTQFVNYDAWTAEAFAHHLCEWFGKNTRAIPVRGELTDLVRKANATRTRDPHIRVARMPAMVSHRVMLAIVGGGYHEAWHTKYSKRDPVRLSEAQDVVDIAEQVVLAGGEFDAKMRGLLMTLHHLIEDIRIERRGNEDFPGAAQPMRDLQDFILDLEVKAREKGAKVKNVTVSTNARSILLCCFRDIGLGYNTERARSTIEFYKETAPGAVELIAPGGILAPMLYEATTLSREDGMGSLRVAMKMVVALWRATQGDRVPEERPDLACPACGAGPKDLILRSVKNEAGIKVKGRAELECKACGFKTEFDLPDNSLNLDQQKQEPEEPEEPEERPDIEDLSQDDVGEGGDGFGDDAREKLRDQLNEKKPENPPEESGNTDPPAEDEGDDEDDDEDDSTVSNPNTEGAAGENGQDDDGQDDDEETGDGDPEDEGTDPEAHTGSGNEEEEDSDAGTSSGEGTREDDGDDGDDERDATGGDDGDGDEDEDRDNRSNRAEKDEKSEESARSDGSPEGDEGEAEEQESDGEGEAEEQESDGEGEAEGEEQENTEGVEFEELDGLDGMEEQDDEELEDDENDDIHLEAQQPEPTSTEAPLPGTEKTDGDDWEMDGEDFLNQGGVCDLGQDPESALHGSQDVLDGSDSDGVMTHQDALEATVESGNERERKDVQKGEMLWNPIDTTLDEARVVRSSHRNFDQDAANEMLTEIRPLVAYTRARLRVIMKAQEMTNVAHGVRRGRRMSQRTMVDTIIDLQSGRMPTRAYVTKDPKPDTSFAVAVLLDQSYSMNDVGVRAVAQAMLLLVDSLDGVGGQTMAFGFRDGKHNPDFSEWTHTQGDYHRVHGVRYDVFKTWDEEFTSVKWRFAHTQAEGWTPMADGIQYGLTALSERLEAHRILAVITDGDPTKPHGKVIRRQLRLAREAGVHVVGIGIGNEAKYVKTLFPDHVWGPGIAEIPKGILEKFNEICDFGGRFRGTRVKLDGPAMGRKVS